MLILMNPKRSNKNICVVGKPGHTDLLKRCRHFTDTLSKFKHQNDLHYTDYCRSLIGKQRVKKEKKIHFVLLMSLLAYLTGLSFNLV